MKRKLVIHVGAHKTGSTFIQNSMKNNASALLENGVSYFGGEDARINFTRDIVYPAVGLRSSGFGNKEFGKACKDIVHDRSRDCSIMFLSNENILGFCDLIKSGGYIYPKAPDVLNFLSCLRGDWEVKFVYAIRDYADFVESSYIQKIKEGFSYSFSEYVTSANLEKLSWIASVEKMRNVFGSNNVWVFRYEDFKASPDYYMEKLGAFVFGNKFSLDIEKNKNANPSYSSVALELARQANSILPKQDVKDYRGYLLKRFPNEKYGRPKLLSEIASDAYREKYREDCSYLGI